MRSVKSESAITWIINDKISVTFHELIDNIHNRAITVFPPSSLIKGPGWHEWEEFGKIRCTIPGIMAYTEGDVFFIIDGTRIWRVTSNGVTLENQHKKICDYLMRNHVLFEFDGESTYLLMKDKAVPLTHSRAVWNGMVSCGSLEIVHASGSRRLAKMVSATDLPISESYEKELLEMCK